MSLTFRHLLKMFLYYVVDGGSASLTPNFQVVIYYEDYYIRQTCILHALICMLLLTNLSLSLSLSCKPLKFI